MGITTDGVPAGGSGVGPDTVGSPEIIDGSVEKHDLAFDPDSTGTSKRTIRLVAASGPLVVGDDLILVDSTVGVVILDCPAAPADGDNFTAVHWIAVNSVTVNGNGKNVSGAPTKNFGNPKQAMTFTYSLAVDEWVIT